jgi:hypothetical protein
MSKTTLAGLLLCCCLSVLAGTGEVTAVSTHWGIHEDVYCAVSNALQSCWGGALQQYS